jgi:ATP-binding cassette subfamily B protein
VVQGAKNFSGGQRQRLSIARMLMKKPEIYVFDDSFSALDFKTDSALRADLKKETTDSIVITIAQRVTTIMDADQILVIDEGRIVGIGTHRELLESCEIYLEIAKSQLTEDELEASKGGAKA